MTRRTPALAVLLLLGLAGCGSDPAAPVPAAAAATPSGPVTVVSCGVRSTYAQAPRRVVLGFPGTLATLDALGVGDRAIGYALGDYAPLPAGYPAAVKELSPDYAPSREAVIAARPDLFLANDQGQVTGKGTLSAQDLRRSGAGLYVLGGYCAGGRAPTSLEVVDQDVRTLGRIFRVPDRAEQVVAQLHRRTAAAAARRPATPLRVAFVQAYDGKLYANGGYPAAGILEALGQVNEWADLKGNFTELSREAALKRTPDALVVVHTGAATERAAIAEVTKALAGTPAVRAGRVIGVDDTDWQAGGVSLIDSLEQTARGLFGS